MRRGVSSTLTIETHHRGFLITVSQSETERGAALCRVRL